MGMWPFGSKRSRRKTHSSGTTARSMTPDETMHIRNISVGSQVGETITTICGPERRKSRKKVKSSKKLQSNSEKRTYSFSPARNDIITVPPDAHQHHPVPPLPGKGKSKTFPESGKENIDLQDSKGDMSRSESQAAVAGTRERQRVPTLHKRGGQDLPRKKSSKKRKEEHDREAEIRAMSASIPTPVRPAVESGFTGPPTKRESRKVRSGLNRHLENPSSDISLPLAGSIHSSLSSNPENQSSYKPINVFFPRPTIKCAEPSRDAPHSSGWTSDGSEGRRKRRSDRMTTIPMDTLNAHKRIDDLADDLDAGDLRELMERDARRRERKKLKDQQKMERKLARRAEKQRQDNAAAVREGRESPKNMDRGVLGRELHGLGIETPGIVSRERRGSNVSTHSEGKPAAVARRSESVNSVPRPADERKRSSSVYSDLPTTGDDVEDPVIATAQVARLSRASMSPPVSPIIPRHKRGPSSLSQMVDLTALTAPPQPASEEEKIAALQAPRRSSEPNTKQPQFAWTSFFKRSKTKRDSNTPSSFSNTSRDSIPTPSAPVYAYPPPTPRHNQGNVPKRTMSKFREDLPELPLSPPDSRVASPEADTVPAPGPLAATEYARRAAAIRGSVDRAYAETSPRARASVRHDKPVPAHRGVETASSSNNNNNNSPLHAAARNRAVSNTTTFSNTDRRSLTNASPSPDPNAQSFPTRSLASIDSEGSWLSGRPAGGTASKRGSTQLSVATASQQPSQHQHRQRDSAGSQLSEQQQQQRRYTREEYYGDSSEDLAITEDEYFTRLTPAPEEGLRHSGGDTDGDAASEEWSGSASAKANAAKRDSMEMALASSDEEDLGGIDDGMQRGGGGTETRAHAPRSALGSPVAESVRARNARRRIAQTLDDKDGRGKEEKEEEEEEVAAKSGSGNDTGSGIGKARPHTGTFPADEEEKLYDVDEEEGRSSSDVMGETPLSFEAAGEEPNTSGRKGYGFDAQGEDADTDTPMGTGPRKGERRATSVDLGRGHVRKISAGSARLLDLDTMPRASRETERP